MKALLFDGSPDNNQTGTRVYAALRAELESRGWQVEHICLRDKKIGNCAGDFFCWIRNPGICNVNDVNRDIAKAMVHSDLLVYLTPITFGGYSSVLKKMVDHQLQNISPFFANVRGETHHMRRYSKYPDFLAIGWMEGQDSQTEMTFRHLAYRNSLNFYAKRSAIGVLRTDLSDSEIQLSVRKCLDDLHHRPAGKATPKLPIIETSPRWSPVRKALLLVGSPRTKNSTSHSIGSYLFDQLSAQDIETRTVHIHTSIHSQERMTTLFEAVDAADLVLLAFPLYIDSLPAPTIETLERITAHRASRNADPTHQQLFAAISNCGFPEPHHNETALTICANFAKQAGFHWAGSLALGAGEGMVHGMPLNELDGRVNMLKKALDLSAAALRQGQPIPDEARALLAKPFVPAWMYRAMGIIGWRQQAKEYGMQTTLKRQPYATERK